jgi:DNA polymerase
MKNLHIDIETYSSVDIRKAGAYKYIESEDFEILLIAYAFDDGPVKIIEVIPGYHAPPVGEFSEALVNPNIKKHAHNANFERQAFKRIGYETPASQWHCSMVKSAYCGLPLSLKDVSKALGLGSKGKSNTGTTLINYFCKPCKPTKTNGGRLRNLLEHNPEKWEQFKEYCIQDVETEREVTRILSGYEMPESERENYLLDQEINDRGILIDLEFAKNAYDTDTRRSKYLLEEMIKLTGLENPNSPAQLKKWLSERLKKEVTTLAKEQLQPLIDEAGPGIVSDALNFRRKLAKTSTKKYNSMLNCACGDGRAHGLFQFYGANRTGRWAGRLVQLQNLPQNHLKDLDFARGAVASGDYDTITMLYEDISSLLSQLIRTAFVAKPGHVFAVADFSAIEARVIAWLAGETWRMDVFRGHGKIYEASAAMMFNIPIEEVTKGSKLRQTGKVAELALGFQGSVGALTVMCEAYDIEMETVEMKNIVKKWRTANPNIVLLWKEIDEAAKRALKTDEIICTRGLEFEYDGKVLTIKLPSGRKLFYQSPSFTVNKWGQTSIKYKGTNQDTKQWGWVDTYGGKLVENIVQAIARDLLAYSMQTLRSHNFEIVMHVHDEAVCEIGSYGAEDDLELMLAYMRKAPDWAKGLPLAADGYLTPYYKKD